MNIFTTAPSNLRRKLTKTTVLILVFSLRVSVDGFRMGDVRCDIADLREQSTVSAINSIKLKEQISVVAPKLVGTLRITTLPLAAVGVRWDDERGIKSYCHHFSILPSDPLSHGYTKHAAALYAFAKNPSLKIRAYMLRITSQRLDSATKSPGFQAHALQEHNNK